MYIKVLEKDFEMKIFDFIVFLLYCNYIFIFLKYFNFVLYYDFMEIYLKI